jgi:S-adenosylmethionine:tRNA ribosyltransferase-isomerase
MVDPAPDSVLLSDYEYALPKERIAQHPAARREDSRLLVLDRSTGVVEHRRFPDLASFLSPGDLLVVNRTRVVQARLYGRKRGTGARIEIFLLRDLGDDRWEALVSPQRRVRSGVEVDLAEGVGVRIERWVSEGTFEVRGIEGGPLAERLERLGEVPLPPYIRRDAVAEDAERYQTVYAREPGAVAAPTAGLHFTETFLDAIRAAGVRTASVLLHTGLGTFRPIANTDVREHRMEAEFFQVDGEAVAEVEACRARGGRVVAVGTTTVRALESAARWQGAERLGAAEGWTDLYIHPPFEFRVVDALVTNFHQPRSTLLVMVSAFAGRDLVLRAYREALEREYRFLSYGDAMLVL